MQNTDFNKIESPWRALKQLIKDEDIPAIREFTDALSRDEMLHTLFKLSQTHQKLLFS
jgi:predicted component of type VI protein secretion system